MTERLPTISEAADQIGIGPRKLMAELRRRKIVNAQNYALPSYIAQWYFRVEQRTYLVRKTNVEKSYWVTTVTASGLIFLRDIADALRGTKRLHAGNGADRATAEREQVSIPGADRSGPVRGVAR